MSIEGVQKSTEQIEGGGREGAAGHEVEGNDGEDNPGITLAWEGRGTGCDRGASSWSLALRWCWGRREQALTDEVRDEQEDIFLWHLGGSPCRPGPALEVQGLVPVSPVRPHLSARDISRST